jgi:predicted AlkP superfamily phosphohydrolase/phosphomutase
MRFSRSRRKPRISVLGLDGVPFGLLARLADQGVMPRTAEILRGGGLRQMRAALPPVSSVSWSSFMTGANPAEHGIFGFTDVDPDSYRLRFPLFSDLAVPTLWDRLGEAGRRSAVINQPATYPARQSPGLLVSGFVALSLEKSVWPAKHLPALQRMGYRIDVDTDGASEHPQRLLADLKATLELRRRAAAHFWELEDWDYFQVVVTETDRLHHFLWSAVAESGAPHHQEAMACYRAVDDFVGECWDLLARRQRGDREGEGFLLLSDHGFCGVQHEVFLNSWLHENGYLQYRTETPQSIADIDPGSRAFALDPGRIHLNRKGRFAQGGVGEDEASGLAAEIAARLSSLEHEGQPAIERIFLRDEIYRGPRLDLAPDLVALGRPGFDLKGATRSRHTLAEPRLQGLHTWDDALVWSKLPLPDAPEISDLAPAILDWLLG